MILKARLSALLNTVKSLMNEKKFDDSLSFYRRINSIYSNLKLESKEEFFDEVESYNFNIGVYFKLKEAMALFEENQDIELIREKLHRIEGLIESVNNSVLHNYVRENYDKLLNAYTALKQKNIFARRLFEIYFFLDANLIDTAIEKYHEIIPIFNTLARYANYDQRSEMYNLLNDAQKAIQGKIDAPNKQKDLKKIEIPKEVQRKKVVKPLKVKKTKVKVENLHKITKDPLNEASLLIKSGNLSEAKRILSKI